MFLNVATEAQGHCRNSVSSYGQFLQTQTENTTSTSTSTFTSTSSSSSASHQQRSCQHPLHTRQPAFLLAADFDRRVAVFHGGDVAAECRASHDVTASLLTCGAALKDTSMLSASQLNHRQLKCSETFGGFLLLNATQNYCKLKCVTTAKNTLSRETPSRKDKRKVFFVSESRPRKRKSSLTNAQSSRTLWLSCIMQVCGINARFTGSYPQFLSCRSCESHLAPQVRSTGQHHCIVLEKSRDQISTCSLGYPHQECSWSSSVPTGNTVIGHKMMTWPRFLARSFQFISHESCYHSTVYNLTYWQRHNVYSLTWHQFLTSLFTYNTLWKHYWALDYWSLLTWLVSNASKMRCRAAAQASE
jgi:hypothetical protein